MCADAHKRTRNLSFRFALHAARILCVDFISVSANEIMKPKRNIAVSSLLNVMCKSCSNLRLFSVSRNSSMHKYLYFHACCRCCMPLSPLPILAYTHTISTANFIATVNNGDGKWKSEIHVILCFLNGVCTSTFEIVIANASAECVFSWNCRLACIPFIVDQNMLSTGSSSSTVHIIYRLCCSQNTIHFALDFGGYRHSPVRSNTKLSKGDNYHMRCAYKISHFKTCEAIAGQIASNKPPNSRSCSLSLSHTIFDFSLCISFR